MWKVWVACILAAVAAGMCVVMGWLSQARITVILYRLLIAAAVSFSAAYGMCFALEKYLVPRFLAEAGKAGSAEDGEAPSESVPVSDEEAAAEAKEEAFTPLTADDLTRVSPPEQ